MLFSAFRHAFLPMKTARLKDGQAEKKRLLQTVGKTVEEAVNGFNSVSRNYLYVLRFGRTPLATKSGSIFCAL